MAMARPPVAAPIVEELLPIAAVVELRLEATAAAPVVAAVMPVDVPLAPTTGETAGMAAAVTELVGRGRRRERDQTGDRQRDGADEESLGHLSSPLHGFADVTIHPDAA